MKPFIIIAALAAVAGIWYPVFTPHRNAEEFTTMGAPASPAPQARTQFNRDNDPLEIARKKSDEEFARDKQRIADGYEAKKAEIKAEVQRAEKEYADEMKRIGDSK